MVFYQFCALIISKGTSPDIIDSNVLKRGRDINYFFFNMSLQTGLAPDLWKKLMLFLYINIFISTAKPTKDQFP